MTRRRLDAELVRRGMAQTRARARDDVLAGKVLVAGAPASKPGRMVADSEPITYTAPPARYVSRGGDKLDHALDAFALDVRGRRVLDVGASTGGFTHCLLERGADAVVALDVGHGQLDWSLRSDDRVVVIERTDVRLVEPAAIGSVDLVTADVSFISLRTVLPSMSALAGHAPILALVKPQFEVGRANVGKGGVVTDPALHAQAVDGVVAAAGALGLSARDPVDSPLAGARGNREIFVLLEPR